MNKYEFPCGCKIDIVDENIKDCDGLPGLYIDYENIREDCPITWELIQSGRTKGIFQLETNLGRAWSKKTVPSNISDMAALSSVIRPGCLRALIDGKSMTERYADRKRCEEEVIYFHEALKPILEETYGILIYQEASISIAKEIAGFNLQEADILRRGIGHKEPEIFLQLKQKFIDGCKRVGTVNEKEAEEIFGWIREGQKYLFNKCLCPNTIVETPNGFKTLSELNIGDFVKAPNEDFTNNEFVEVIDKIDTGKQMVYEITLESGKSIQCTLDHEFLCKDGKKRKLFDIIEEKHEICVYMQSEKIISIKSIGYKKTVDIEIKNKHHLFYANEIITSNSHGVGYGKTGYWTAYAKAHFPIHFYTAWLSYAHEKIKPQEEIQLLISDARYFQKDIMPPSLARLFNGDPGSFSLYKNRVYFGIGDIKKIGKASVDKCLKLAKESEDIIGKPIHEWSWNEFLIHFSDKIGQSVTNNIIAAGATDYMGMSRNQKVGEYNVWMKLTAKEREWIKDNVKNTTNLRDIISELLEKREKTTANRRKKIEDQLKIIDSAKFSHDDDAYYIARHEQELLGIPITCTKLDTCSSDIETNTTCKEFIDGKTGKISIAVEITEVKSVIITRGDSQGQTMYFLTVEDKTGSIDSVMVFPSVIKDNLSILIAGSTVIIHGRRDNNRKETLIVENIIQI